MSMIRDGKGEVITPENPLHTHIAGNMLMEQKTQADAVAGKVTFSKLIQHLEIYNTDSVNEGKFTVNGIVITIPKNESFKASFGGIPSVNVVITGATTYILTRYE